MSIKLSGSALMYCRFFWIKFSVMVFINFVILVEIKTY